MMAPFGLRQFITRIVPRIENPMDIKLVIMIVKHINLFMVMFAALCVDSLTGRVLRVL